MSEPVTALGGACIEGLVRIVEQPLQGMIALKGDLADAKIRNAATGVTGIDLPGPLEGRVEGERGLAWMAPDELLLFVPYAEVARTMETIGRALKGRHATLADMSDARAVFRLDGAAGREVLARLTPADMAPEAFGPGRFRRSRLGQVPAAIWCESPDRFGLICFRSVAVYVRDLLTAAAAAPPVGYFPAGG
ncbi:sarcosine oxidase subunit gamma [Rhodovulum sulfidophilum]|uniref:Sarcosine oxidase subunit gamma n=1 Tax=Rhodovulum sulfidophilum TaxID=35806 RepID=A0ABS1RSL7_RHOSU|nr:sarcosine oxidase subunit gamma family protein [Rhodovulum sulfidophilum]MBL3608648.1 sarcosine oxidase subunit gamma [Rhodovulum sulfidophilum]MCE8457281.1 sarcosine oxidase subunit gamma [Rhodovulum sulfidophilum]